MGGEKIVETIADLLLMGSPPHGRGKGCRPFEADLCGGITPAWAGKSKFFCNTCVSKGDHPRMGGEKTA